MSTAHTESKLINDYLVYLEVERNRSERTVRNYDFYLRRFFEWLMAAEQGANPPSPKKRRESLSEKIPATFEQKINPANITLNHVRDYRVWLNRWKDSLGKGMKKNTQNYHLIALRSFLKYLAKRDIKTLAAEKIELARMPERNVEFLEEGELERLLDAPLVVGQGRIEDPLRMTLVQLRDKTILEMLFSTGLRVSELAGLVKEMVNLKEEEFTVRGKGDKPRVAFLSHQSRFWLKAYLDRRRDFDPHLFVSHDRAKHEREEAGLTPRSIQRIVERYARAAGITKRITPHTMRHTFATDLLKNGADIRSVQTMLGHSSITTTQIYTHITDQRLRQVYKEFHGRKRKK